MLQKQPVNINFSQGVDTKTDPFQVPIGKFLSLQNAVFDKIGRLTKRNGFGALGSLPDNTSRYLTTFNNNLVALGTELLTYNPASASWLSRGAIKPVELNTAPIVRNGAYQSYSDSMSAIDGTTCVAFVDYVPIGTSTVPTMKVTIVDTDTGQALLDPQTISDADPVYGAPKVFRLGAVFIVLYVSSLPGYPLRYCIVSAAGGLSSPTNIASSTVPSLSHSYDGIVIGSQLFIAYNTTVGGQAIVVTSLNTSYAIESPIKYDTYKATSINLAADPVPQPNHLYIAFYDSAASAGYITSMNLTLGKLVDPPVQFTSTANVTNIACAAYNGKATVFYEVANSYTYGSNLPTNYVKKCTYDYPSLTANAESVLIRSVGLASEAFLIAGVPYVLTAYESDFQPTYFLVDTDGILIAKLAYSNGGGYCRLGTPNVTVLGDTAYMSYLFRATIQAANKTQGVANPAGVFAQLGVNLASIDFSPSTVSTSEIGNNLQYSGGYLSSYDGLQTTENGFFVYPDNIYAASTTKAVAGKTGATTLGSNIITNVSNILGIYVGMQITGAGIPANTTIVNILSGDPTNLQLVLDNACTATAIGVALTISANVSNQQYYYQVTYEWADNQGNLFRSAPSIPFGITKAAGDAIDVEIPTLRVTDKTQVKIVVYRWSAAQPAYYQVSSIIHPLLNDKTVDSVTFTDVSSDAQILGNNLIYTTGGVVENISPPAATIMTLFDNRQWLVDSENQNLLWFSKQVIANTPVEMSDLFTRYIAPTTASQGSTGKITALSPMDDKLIIFKRNALGYINGTGPDNAGGNSQYSDFTLINSVVGCTNQKSIVFTPNGLMFQSANGIWLLGRDLSTSYIGAPVESLTAGANVYSAVNVPGTTQVRFTLDSGVTLMYDYFFQQWGTFTNIPALSSTIYDNLHTYINSFGQVLQETPGHYLDNTSPVLMKFVTGWINLAGLQGFERFYSMYLLGQYITPFNLNVQIGYDYNPSAAQSTLVTPDNYAANYGNEQLWGSGPVWGGASNVFEARVFPQRQKCESFQLSINEVYDSTKGQAAGAGLTLSGLNLVVGLKKVSRTSPAARNFG